MKLKLISDGTMYGTVVKDADTDTPIGMIQKITYEVSTTNPNPTMTITILNVPCEIVGDLTETIEINVEDYKDWVKENEPKE